MNKFNDIHLKIKTISEKSQRGYRIYSDKTNFTLVEAATVSEAIEKSGIKNPAKIEIAGVITKSIFNQAELAEKLTSQQVPNTTTSPSTSA
jgi:hypothetical protein